MTDGHHKRTSTGLILGMLSAGIKFPTPWLLILLGLTTVGYPANSAADDDFASDGFIKLSVQRNLACLGYGVAPFDGKMGGKTQVALRQYQKRNKLPVTGKIDSDTFGRLSSDRSAVERPVHLPLPSWTDSPYGHLFVSGVWKRDGLSRLGAGYWREGNDIFSSAIHCYFDIKVCVEAEVDFHDDVAKHINPSTNLYRITQMNSTEILAVEHASESNCYPVAIKVDLLAKQIHKVITRTCQQISYPEGEPEQVHLTLSGSGTSLHEERWETYKTKSRETLIGYDESSVIR